MGRSRRRSKHSTTTTEQETIKEQTLRLLPPLSSHNDEMSSSPRWARIFETTIVLGIVPLLIGAFLHSAGVVSITDTDVSSLVGIEELISNINQSWSRFNGSFIPIIPSSDSSDSSPSVQSARPGFYLSQQGAKAKHPIIMVPGFVTSGLEVWGGEECAKKHFRQRLWGALDTLTTFFTDRDCFLQHLALDPSTGGDPDRIRLRPAQGFEAADYFMATYWVWDKLILNLADVGYDGSSMVMMSYDWRLSFPMLEKRDGYLTKLKHTIEAYHKTSGEKVVMSSHSMGGQLVLFFFAWVTREESDGGGGGGADWVDKHIHAFINIAGPLLGVPKASTALMSGEMRESSVLLGTVGSMLETFFGKQKRKDLFSTWGSVWAMLPKGGNDIWGSGVDICPSTNTTRSGLICLEGAIKNETDSAAPLLKMTGSPLQTATANNTVENTCNSNSENGKKGVNNIGEKGIVKVAAKKELNKKILQYLAEDNSFTAEETIDFLIEWGGGFGKDLSAVQWLSTPTTYPSLHNNDNNAKKKLLLSSYTWLDPTVTPLPHAPSMKLYCLYGVGSKSERAYFYKRNDPKTMTAAGDDIISDNVDQCINNDENNNLSVDYNLPFFLDTSYNDKNNDIINGVKFVDGDGSVPLLSSGYMCNEWASGLRKDLNPSDVGVVTREYVHHRSTTLEDPMRGGPQAADHVDILGNVGMIEDFLRIVTDFDTESKVHTQLFSDIKHISRRVNQQRRINR